MQGCICCHHRNLVLEARDLRTQTFNHKVKGICRRLFCHHGNLAWEANTKRVCACGKDNCLSLPLSVHICVFVRLEKRSRELSHLRQDWEALEARLNWLRSNHFPPCSLQKLLDAVGDVQVALVTEATTISSTAPPHHSGPYGRTVSSWEQ